MKRIILMVATCMLFFSDMALADKLPLRFPLHLKPGMSREEIQKLTDKAPSNNSGIVARWPIWEDIVYFQFHPQYIVGHFHWEGGETPIGNLESVGLVQNFDNCNDLSTAFVDASAFVVKTYDVTPAKSDWHPDYAKESCGWDEIKKWVGHNGNAVTLEAVDIDGKPCMMLEYSNSHHVGMTQEQKEEYEKTKSNL